MPLPRTGHAEFNPVLYNYQSEPGAPAVLTLLVTRQGTSATIIENNSGDQSFQGWGQQLFFNREGQRTTFTAERRSAVEHRIERQGEQGQDRGALEEGADMLMVIQVPLVHRTRRDDVVADYADQAMPMAAPPASASRSAATERARESDVEQAVLGHGQDLGSFREMGGLRLRRDARFPIRVTVQFYRATSNGVVSDDDLRAVKANIDRVYNNADYVGSLVVPESDHPRPTSWMQRVREWFVQ